MGQEKKVESRQEVMERRIETLKAAGYTQNWTSGIAFLADIVEACYVVACDIAEDNNINEPESFERFVIAFTEMLFSKVQIMGTPPQSREGLQLMRAMPFPDLKPNQN